MKTNRFTRSITMAGAMLTASFGITLAQAESLPMIPQPQSHEISQGEFTFGANVSFSAQGDCKKEVEFFASELRKVTGWAVPVQAKGTVGFFIDPSIKKGYELEVSPDAIKVRAGNTANLFYAFQTIRQLAPAQVFSSAKQDSLAKGWKIPCASITDSPKYEWRGVLVDVSRKFQTKEEIMKLLDSMAMVKLNKLHFHLTDNEGWRAEIKGYPKLTQKSKQYYSQKDLKEMVAYASLRGITIIPEVDLPGHCWAVAKAYPSLCVANPKKNWSYGILDVTNPKAYEFIDTVFRELTEIFPSEYIHIGADEVNKGWWKHVKGYKQYMADNNISNLNGLQAHFVTKVAAIVRKYDRKPIAWDEALEGGADSNLAIMSWRGVGPGHKSAERNHKVVICPVSALYYDRAQSRSKAHPAGYSANTTLLSQSYFTEPASPLLTEKARANIMGAQGCVWGEHIISGDNLQRQVMLRGAALAESLWSPRSQLDWNDFLKRLVKHRARLDAASVPYWWEPSTLQQKVAELDLDSGTKEFDIDLSAFVKSEGLHEFLFPYKSGKGSFKIHQVTLFENGKEVSQDTHPHTATIDPRRPDQFYLLTLKKFNPTAKYTLKIKAEALKGSSKCVVMLTPPLKEADYDKARSPKTNSNRYVKRKGHH